jgi:antirestriction protein ArdC
MIVCISKGKYPIIWTIAFYCRLDVFKSDTRILIKAASRAQQAVEYILNPKVEEVVAVDEPELEMELEEA